ncbi:MAG: transcriptional regulator [Rickettsiaceae bacterium]|jgi:TrpR-related protein YerC/YecD|nr:transcriptional regulator [Rickettsiaceae bacterium]
MNNDKSVSLLDTILAIETKDQLGNFLKDLCTPAELRSLDERWKVCQLLAKENLSYREIHAITGASLTTIGRVARFLKEERYGGYRNILAKLGE